MHIMSEFGLCADRLRWHPFLYAFLLNGEGTVFQDAAGLISGRVVFPDAAVSREAPVLVKIASAGGGRRMRGEDDVVDGGVCGGVVECGVES